MSRSRKASKTKAESFTSRIKDGGSSKATSSGNIEPSTTETSCSIDKEWADTVRQCWGQYSPFGANEKAGNDEDSKKEEKARAAGFQIVYVHALDRHGSRLPTERHTEEIRRVLEMMKQHSPIMNKKSSDQKTDMYLELLSSNPPVIHHQEQLIKSDSLVEQGRKEMQDAAEFLNGRLNSVKGPVKFTTRSLEKPRIKESSEIFVNTLKKINQRHEINEIQVCPHEEHEFAVFDIIKE